MGGEVVKIPRSDAMLAALDRVVEVARETDDNAAFEVPIREFWRIFFADCRARGLCDKWSPLVVLLLLERCLLADESLPVDVRVDRCAALATIRQLISEFRVSQQAALN